MIAGVMEISSIETKCFEVRRRRSEQEKINVVEDLSFICRYISFLQHQKIKKAC